MIGKTIGRIIRRLLKGESYHEHKFLVLQEVRHAPIIGGGHTDYFLMKCTLCSETLIFGEDNFKLTTPEHQKTVHGFVESHGLQCPQLEQLELVK